MYSEVNTALRIRHETSRHQVEKSGMTAREIKESETHDLPKRETRTRMMKYALLAPIAAVGSADGAIHSSGALSIEVGFTPGALSNYGLSITNGASTVASINFNASFHATSGGTNPWSIVQINGTNMAFRAMRLRGTNTDWGNSTWTSNVAMGVPVGSGATWNALGVTAGQFAGTGNYSVVNSNADIAFGYDASGSMANDPAGVDGGQTSFLLFKLDGGAAAGNYGWLSFTANIPNTTPGSNDASITITGWGWDDSGNPIAAGATAVPGASGLLGLALGAAGLRRNRKRTLA